MKLAAILATISTASAFTINPAARISTSLNVNQMSARKRDTMVDATQRSAACPWLTRPVNLDGTMVGDVGFDPLYLSSIEKNFAGFIQPPQWEDQGDGISTLYWMREAEVRPSRSASEVSLGECC